MFLPSKKSYQVSKPEMEFNMMNITYMSLCMCANIEKTTLSCKDDYCKALPIPILEAFYVGGMGYVLDFVGNIAISPCTLLIHRPDYSTAIVNGLYICTYNTNSGYNTVRNRTPILA